MIKNPKNLLKIHKILKFYKTKSAKKSIFPFEFEESKNCPYDRRWLNLDVTFCSDTFSYKKLFNPTSYAKVIAVLLWHNVFLQNISKFEFLIFHNN
jgi:hypothetical protein